MDVAVAGYNRVSDERESPMPNDKAPPEPAEAPERASEDDAEAGGGWPLLSDLDLGVCLATRPRLEAEGGTLGADL